MRKNHLARIGLIGGLAVAGACCVSAPTLAAEQPASATQRDGLFEKLDVNHDGRISRDEGRRLKGFESAFNQADSNKDGYLSADEFIKAHAIYERNNVARYADDATITARVKAALLADADLNPLAVSVQTQNGRVILSGFVDRSEQIAKAVKVATSVSGVRSVKNALETKE